MIDWWLSIFAPFVVLIFPLLPRGYISPTEHAFGSHETDLSLIVKLKNLKVRKKYELEKNYEIHIAKNVAIFKNVFPKICHKLGKHLPYFLSNVWQSCRDLHVRDRNRHLRSENIWLKSFKDRQSHYSDFVVILFITRQPRESR